MKYQYRVVFNQDSGKPYISSRQFHSHSDALVYAESISPSRSPVVIPFIPLSPTTNDEFTCHDLEEMAGMLKNVKDLFLFGFNDSGMAARSQHHYMQAINHISNAIQSIMLADIEQASATK